MNPTLGSRRPCGRPIPCRLRARRATTVDSGAASAPPTSAGGKVTSLAHPSNQRGAVLLLVLVLIAIAATAILSFTERALSEISGEGYYAQRDRLRADAYSTLEVSLAVLNDFKSIDGGLFSPEQGWGTPLAYAGLTPREGLEIEVEFFDENARLPLLAGDSAEPWLLVLFTDLGFQSDEIAVLTDSLLDWIDEDDNPRLLGAESEEYLRSDLPHIAANRMPTRLEELSAAIGWSHLMFNEAGMPNARFEEFKRLVSVYSSGPINLNTASERVLRATGVFSEPELMALRDAFPERQGGPRRGKGYYTSPIELADTVGALPSVIRLGVKVEVVSVIVTVREGDAEFRLRAVVRVDSSSAQGGGTPSEGGAGAPIPPPRLPGGGSELIGQGDRDTGVSSGVQGAGEVGSPEFPFTIVELVEDPPASSIDPTAENP
jgi:type II secretory pathway component PulK